MSFNYFYGGETERFLRFYRVPKALLLEDISLEAATLYGLMLDRVGLSVRNGWTGDQGRIYIYFTQKDVQKFLRCGHNRATAFMRELERFGLIERKRQGLGRPAKIYVKNFASSEEEADAGRRDKERNQKAAFSSAQKEAVRTAPLGRSGVPEGGGQDCPAGAANDTKKKETDSSETNRILPLAVAGSVSLASPQAAKLTHCAAPALPTEIAALDFRGGPMRAGSASLASPQAAKLTRASALPTEIAAPDFRGGPMRMDEMRWFREEIRENIDYEGLLMDRPRDRETVDGYVELMTEAACSSRKAVRICGQELPTPEVRRRFLTLERSHIEYVRDCLRHNTTAIGNIKAYTLAALYNAPATMEQYYDALVSRDYGALCPA